MFLTADELAVKLKVTRSAVRKWQRQGVPFIPVGRLRRYQEESVLSWLVEREEKRLANRKQRQERNDVH